MRGESRNDDARLVVAHVDRLDVQPVRIGVVLGGDDLSDTQFDAQAVGDARVLFGVAHVGESRLLAGARASWPFAYNCEVQLTIPALPKLLLPSHRACCGLP